MRVLDIGSGWGGTALYLNRVADVDVLGITLSEEQLKVARRRAEEAGVADRVKFELIDYRDGAVTCKGFYCYDDAFATPQPAVLISHALWGRDEFVERKARRLAWHGYACFALDMYGDGDHLAREAMDRYTAVLWHRLQPSLH